MSLLLSSLLLWPLLVVTPFPALPPPPPLASSRSDRLVGEWQEAESGETLLFADSGRYGPAEILSLSVWHVDGDRIWLDFCFGSRSLQFHFERALLVIGDGHEKGRYRRVRSVP